MRKSGGIDRVTKRREGGEGARLQILEDHGARIVNTNLSTRKKEKRARREVITRGRGATIDES